MSKWEVKQPLDYSPTGDDIDSASLKIIATFNDVYDKLNRLRSNDADAGITVGDEAPFQWKIDTTTNPAAFLIGNADGTGFIRIGTVEENFGFDADTVGAIKKGGDIGKVSLGRESGLPSDAETYDLYIAYDTARVYIYLTGAWRVILSLQFGDLLNVSNDVVMKSEVAENGAGKIVRLNSVGQGEFDVTGSPGKLVGKDMYIPSLTDDQVLAFNASSDRWEAKDRDAGFSKTYLKRDEVAGNGAEKVPRLNSTGEGDFDITGSAAKIVGKSVYAPELKDNQVLVYNAARDRWDVKDRDDITFSDVTTTGEADKIVKTDEYGKIHCDITGSAEKLAGKGVDIGTLSDGDALVFDFTTGTFKNKKIAVLNSDGVLEGNVSGSANKWAGRSSKINGIQDGQVLVWNESLQAFVNSNQGGIGTARNLSLSVNGGSTVEYNGSERVAVDIQTFVVSETEPSSACIWIKPTDGSV